MKRIVHIFLVLWICFANTSIISAKLHTVNLLCEYHKDPIGIDIEKPRFSWQLVSDENNVLQTLEVKKR